MRIILLAHAPCHRAGVLEPTRVPFFLRNSSPDHLFRWADRCVSAGDLFEHLNMLEGTLSVFAFIVVFPLAVFLGLIFLIRNFIRTTEFCDSDLRFDGKTIVVTGKELQWF